MTEDHPGDVVLRIAGVELATFGTAILLVQCAVHCLIPSVAQENWQPMERIAVDLCEVSNVGSSGVRKTASAWLAPAQAARIVAGRFCGAPCVGNVFSRLEDCVALWTFYRGQPGHENAPFGMPASEGNR